MLKSIQAIPFELNLRKEKWLVISIYRPPSQDSEFFLTSLTVILNHFTKAHNNYLITGDFNLEPHDKRLGYFLNSNSLVNLVKTNTCFKGKGCCIDLILTNRKYSFKNTTSYETELSDHHHMILTILKTTFQQKEPKCLIYRNYKNFIFENFQNYLQETLQSCKGLYDIFDNNFTSCLNKHAPKKRVLNKDLYKWESEITDLGLNDSNQDYLDITINKYEKHPSIQMIKQKFRISKKFSLEPVSKDEVKKIIKDLKNSKSVRGEIPTKIFKECDFMFDVLTQCIKKSFTSGEFSDCLKQANVSPIFKKDDPLDKENYRPVSILLLLSKAYEKLLYNRLSDYEENIFNVILCGFRKSS